MIKYFILIIFCSVSFAQSNQPLSRLEQLHELKKIEAHYISQKKPVPLQVKEGIQKLEKEFPNQVISQPVPNQQLLNKPKIKTVCKKVKTKSGKIVNQCKPVKVQKKYHGKPVPIK